MSRIQNHCHLSSMNVMTEQQHDSLVNIGLFLDVCLFSSKHPYCGWLVRSSEFLFSLSLSLLMTMMTVGMNAGTIRSGHCTRNTVASANWRGVPALYPLRCFVLGDLEAVLAHTTAHG